MRRQNTRCECIRCREPRGDKINWDNVKLNRINYDASNGKEIFLSFDDDDKILGFLRLRIPCKPFRKEITENSALVRELHVYGEAISLGEKGEVQHKGLGLKLMEEAEKISKELSCKKVKVISGIGVKEYYRKKLCYKDDGAYLSKMI